MIKNITLKFVYIFILTFLCTNLANSENKIKVELKVGDEILTNIDFLNEKNYLIALNNSLKTLPKNQLKNIAKSPPEKLSPKFLSSHAGDKHDLPKKHRKRFPDGRVGSHSIMATPEKGKVLFETAVKCISKEIKIISKEL